MSLWGNVDNANNRPKYANTSAVTGMTVAEAQANTGVAHPGWVQVTVGQGAVVSIAISAGGTGYANGAALSFANTNGSGAAATLSTNSTGGITSLTITAGGLYSAAPVITAPTGTGANLVATVAGRAGRTQKETLVAMSSMT